MDEQTSTASSESDGNADELFDALSDRHRRHVLAYLHDADGAVELEELVDCIVTRDADREADRREAVATQLHHVHLPKMADIGLLDYDARASTVSNHDRPERREAVALLRDATEVLREESPDCSS